MGRIDENQFERCDCCKNYFLVDELTIVAIDEIEDQLCGNCLASVIVAAENLK